MRTLRLLSFGPGRPCWSAQVAPLYIASQQRSYIAPAVATAHEFAAGVRVRDAESRFGFGIASPQRRLYSLQVAGKKGKKDVLVKEEEEPEPVLEDKTTTTTKKKKAKENGDALDVESKEKELKELLTELKEKKKHAKKDEGEVEEAVHAVQNGAVSGDLNVQPTEGKEKKKKGMKNKSKSKVEAPVEDAGAVVESSHKKQKEKKSKKFAGNGATSEDTEESKSFENVDESATGIEDDLADELEEHLDDDDFWEDDFEPEAELNDGGDGGGVVLGDAPWAKTVLELAEETVAEFDGALEIFAFKVSKDAGIIRVRVDKLSDKYGSPTMEELQKFSSSYSKRLDQAGEAKSVPDDLALEVSSPGAERVVRIPQDLDRFKDLPMYVRYVETASDDSSEAETPEKDGVLELESVDMENGTAKWKLADVRLNRELAGKGRGLNKKQRDWRADLKFESIQLVRLYIDL